MLVPSILNTLDEDEQILVVTSNCEALKPSFSALMKKYCYIGDDQILEDRFRIIGGENVDGFGREIQNGEKIDIARATPGFVKLIGDAIGDSNNNIGAILFECTELPIYGDVIKEKFRLPVWHAINAADYIYGASAGSFKSSIQRNIQY